MSAYFHTDVMIRRRQDASHSGTDLKASEHKAGAAEKGGYERKEGGRCRWLVSEGACIIAMFVVKTVRVGVNTTLE